MMNQGREYPKPSENYIVLRNPIKTLAVKSGEELAKMPPAEREKYQEEQVTKLWSKMEIEAAGPTSKYNAGDVVCSAGHLMANAIYPGTEEYLMIRDNVIVGTW